MIATMDVTCSVQTCERPRDRKGYCGAHYMQQYRYGTTSLVGPQPKACSTCGETFQPKTNRVAYCSDVCRRGEGTCVSCGRTFLIKKGATGLYCSRDCWYTVDRVSRPCPVCGDLFKSSAKTCSVDCGQELRKRNNPDSDRACEECGASLAGKKRTTRFCSHKCSMAGIDDRPGAAHPVGKRRRREDGYIEVKTDSGRWALEHRYAMEQLLGRPLVRGESVHHINGDRSNNTTNGAFTGFRSGNLELWSTSQPKGQRVDQKVDWAIELLRQYRPDLLTEHCPGCRCGELTT